MMSAESASSPLSGGVCQHLGPNSHRPLGSALFFGPRVRDPTSFIKLGRPPEAILNRHLVLEFYPDYFQIAMVFEIPPACIFRLFFIDIISNPTSDRLLLLLLFLLLLHPQSPLQLPSPFAE